MPNLSLDKLRKKVAYCHEVVDALTILEPGISPQRGLTLYELWFGETELARRLEEQGKLDREEYGRLVREAAKWLEEAAM